VGRITLVLMHLIMHILMHILIQPPSSYKTSNTAETHDTSTHATIRVTIQKFVRTMCIYSTVQYLCVGLMVQDNSKQNSRVQSLKEQSQTLGLRLMYIYNNHSPIITIRMFTRPNASVRTLTSAMQYVRRKSFSIVN